MKAFLFGSLIAFLCAFIYYAVMRITGMDLALVTIGMGWGIGRAVFMASGDRGGWGYQFLAACLTYLAISAGLSAAIMTDVLNEPDSQPAVVASATPGAAETPAPAEDDTEPPPTLASVLLGLGAILVAAPVLVCMESPVCILIYGFGLFEAWKQCRLRPVAAE